MKEKLGAVLMCLVFAVPFGGIGAGAAYVIGRMIHDGQRAEEWVRVKATVDAYGHGTAEYRYTFQGREYHGDRLGANPIGGTDNIDSWHDDIYSMLASAKSENKPITVWVNPGNPAESMVDRTIRWKLVMFASVFALAFGGVGVGALVMLFVNLFGALMPARPARARPSAGGSGLGSMWLFTFFWNVISIPIALLVVPDAVTNGEWVALLVLLFPLIGLLMLWGSIAQTIRAIRNAFKSRFARTSEAPVVAPAARPVNDGGFARGMLDDPRMAADLIDVTDDGVRPPQDPAMAELERLSGKKLTAEQREQFEKMGPTGRKMVGRLAGWLDKTKVKED